jgi:MoaA/NifB/PqqE/SkfB family radical SAM enzyme
MAVPVSQMWTVASYVLRQKLAGRKRYPLVLMLEPLFRCNLACAGCRKTASRRSMNAERRWSRSPAASR